MEVPKQPGGKSRGKDELPAADEATRGRALLLPGGRWRLLHQCPLPLLSQGLASWGLTFLTVDAQGFRLGGGTSSTVTDWSLSVTWGTYPVGAIAAVPKDYSIFH